jgi:hypothetical protein
MKEQYDGKMMEDRFAGFRQEGGTMIAEPTSS